MKLYLIRHAIAEDAAGYEDDSLRPLTKKGHEKMKKIAKALENLGVKPGLIVSSPFLRARQTASVLARELKYEKEIIQSDSLVPMGKPDDMIGEINEKFQVEELMLVGHEPNMSSLTGTLLAVSPELAINFKKGGVCCLTVDNLGNERKATLEWLLTPKIAMRMN